MKCDVCGKEVSDCGLEFDVRQVDRLTVCPECYGHLFHLKYRSTKENVMSSSKDYFDNMSELNKSYGNNGGSFGLNGIFVPLTKEYLQNHSGQDLTNKSIYTQEVEPVNNSLDEIRDLLIRNTKRHEDTIRALEPLKDLLGVLVGISAMSFILSIVALFLR